MDVLTQCLIDILRKHHDDKVDSQALADGKMVLQMVFSKLIHIRKILTGVEFVELDGRVSINGVIDPTVVNGMVRNLYEMVCMYHIVYDVPKSDDSKTIMYGLWVIAGLKYRQRFKGIARKPENVKKVEDEAELITKFTETIKNTGLYNSMTLKNKGKIDRLIQNKNFQCSITNEGEVAFLSWQEIGDMLTGTTTIFDDIYTYFSLYAHPSNVSVFQFGEMFRKDSPAFIQITNLSIRFTIALASVFIGDYVKVYPEVINTINDRSNFQVVLINFYNKMLRGDEYSFSDKWKVLG